MKVIPQSQTSFIPISVNKPCSSCVLSCSVSSTQSELFNKFFCTPCLMGLSYLIVYGSSFFFYYFFYHVCCIWKASKQVITYISSSIWGKEFLKIFISNNLKIWLKLISDSQLSWSATTKFGGLHYTLVVRGENILSLLKQQIKSAWGCVFLPCSTLLFLEFEKRWCFYKNTSSPVCLQFKL